MEEHEIENDPKLPLAGIVVLDFATILAGPVASTFLGDFGAEVIKVELPGKGDVTRRADYYKDGRSPMWLVEGRNKKSITLDLHHGEGQKIAHKLVEKADVAVFNFRPGKAESWGIGPEDLHKTNPGLIILQISAYGQTGPYSKRTGFDRTIQTFAGTTYVTGYPDRPPVRSGFALVDYMTSYLGAFGVMTALYHRDANGGKGEVVDLSLAEAAFRASESALIDYSITGNVRERQGNSNPFVVPASNFITKDGRNLVMNANTERMWTNLAQAMGMPELIEDARFKAYPDRVENQEALYEIICTWVGELTADGAIEKLVGAGVPADYMRDISDLAEDPHLLERDAVINMIDDQFGKIKVPGIFPKLSNSPGKIRHLGGKLGDYNQEIYGELLGLSDDEIAALGKKGVI
jgi:crotonobetainyl-CoA:carnitine CoA-transferase CaiB-like acyl-CoA transferase